MHSTARRPTLRMLFFAALALSAATSAPASSVRFQSGAPVAPVAPAPRVATTEPLVVERVVDADTIHVLRGGEIEKLRLLCVDTEEKLAAGMTSSPSKPQTVYGEECAIWAREFFASLAGEDGKTRVRLAFPGGREERDVFGRLLCHVLLPDGSDFNLRLVREGRSPYFAKYGRCLTDHEAFVAAEAHAREAQLGIWNPATNAPADPSAPAAKRPYERLVPWWNARAEAVEDFRRRSAAEPGLVIAAEDPAALEKALASEHALLVFGEPEKLFEEEDGSLTVLFRSGARDRALRVRVPADAREAHAVLDLPALLLEYRQNYVYVRGLVRDGARGPEIVSDGPGAWRRAGPEPAPHDG